MRLFNKSIATELNSHVEGSQVSFIGLGNFNFDLVMDFISIQAEHEIDFLINGMMTKWKSGPSDTPVWRLIGQHPTSISLKDNQQLQILFESEDAVTIHTEDSPYECVQISIGKGTNTKNLVF